MMRKYYLLFIISSISLNLFGQILPDSLANLWTNTGNVSPPNYTDTINAVTFGLAADSSASNTADLNTLISGLTNSTVIYFPAGTYAFDGRINLQSNVSLQGDGTDTKFYFNQAGTDNLIQATGTVTADTSSVIHTIPLNETKLRVNNSSLFTSGDMIALHFNDTSVITSTWAYQSVMQLFHVSSISGDTLFIDQPNRLHIPQGKTPYVQKIEPVENVGIKCLYMERLDASSGQTSNIAFQYVHNAHVIGVESYMTNYTHVELSTTSNTEIWGCYFHESHGHGGGGQGYGVTSQYGASENRVVSNIFHRLRHSILVQAGANGNTFGYNYSYEPYWTDVGALPSGSAGELVCHGNYPFANLFEGNAVDNIIVDDSHGINGPYNAFFRNRADGYGITMNSSPATDRVFWVGNEVTNTGLFMGLYWISGNDHLEYGNNIKGTATPNNTDDITEASWMYSEYPWYFETARFPIIGYPNTLSEYQIEASNRNQQATKTRCEETEGPVDGLDELQQSTFKLYPNPTNTTINVEGVPFGTPLSIMDVQGRMIMETKLEGPISIQGLTPGVYFVKVNSQSQRLLIK